MERLVYVVLLAGLALCCTANVMLDTSPTRIYYMHIDSKIRFRFATTVFTSKVVNPSTNASEAVFRCTLPKAAYITNFTLLMDGQTIVGEVKEKQAASRQYEAAISRGESAAHITTQHRETNKFDIKVNVAAAAKVVFHLTYQELLMRKDGIYNHVIVVDPGQVVEDFQITIDLKESRNIALLRVPPLRNDLLTDIDINATNNLAVIQKPDSRSAFIIYSPTPEEQAKRSEEGLNAKFVLQYDVERQMDYGDILVVDGYFVHFFAPEGNDLQSLPKDVLFILDKSGSMSGRKIQQLSNAMRNILDDLRPEDRFGIITFDSYAHQPWLTNRENVFTPATVYYVDLASTLVQNIQASGGTNIDAALSKGISVIRERRDSSRTPVIVFLTDGQPTVGLQSTQLILQNIREMNDAKIPIFTLAFGIDADFDFTRKLAVQNHGFGRKIYEDSDADLQISGFYREIATVLLRNVRFEYMGDTVNQSTLTSTNLPLYFKGAEYIVAGKLQEGTNNEIPTVSVTAAGSNGNLVIAVPDVTLDLTSLTSNITDDIDFRKITEHLWAYLTVKQYWKELQKTDDASERQSWKAKVLDLALKYHFVTPLTSMVVTLPNREPMVCDLSAIYRSTQRDLPKPPFRSGIFQSAHVHSRLPPLFTHKQSYSPKTPNYISHTGIFQSALVDTLLPPLFTHKLSYSPKTPYISHTVPLPIVDSYGTMKRRRRPGSLVKRQKKKIRGKGKKSKKRFSKRIPAIPAVAVGIPGISEPLCFNVRSTIGKFENVLSDVTRGYRITAMTTSATRTSRRRHRKRLQSYFSEIKINSTDLPEIHYFQDQITSGNQTLRYADNPNVHYSFNGVKVSVHLMNQSSSTMLQLHASFPSTSNSTLGGMLGPFADAQVTKGHKKGRKTIFVLSRGTEKTKLNAITLHLSENFMGDSRGDNRCWYILNARKLRFLTRI